MENVNFILKCIPGPSSYIKNLLEIVVKLKIKKCWPITYLTFLPFEQCTPLIHATFSGSAASAVTSDIRYIPSLAWTVHTEASASHKDTSPDIAGTEDPTDITGTMETSTTATSSRQRDRQGIDRYNDAITYGGLAILGLGLAANTLSFGVIWKSAMSKLSIGVYLCSLACFDNLALLGWVLLWYLKPQFSGLCNVMRFVLPCTSSLCALNVVCLTADRFIAVWFPLHVKQLVSRQKAYLIIAVVTVLCLALFLPSLILLGPNCEVLWASVDAFYALNLGHYFFNVIYYGSVICILCLNSAIFGRLVASRFGRNHLASTQIKDNKAAVTVLAVSITYVVCVLPFNIVTSLYTLKRGTEGANILLLLNAPFRLLLLTNHAINFVLYVLTSANFRASLLRLVRSLVRAPMQQHDGPCGSSTPAQDASSTSGRSYRTGVTTTKETIN